MKIAYRNQQYQDDPLNGAMVESERELTGLLEQARHGKPVFIRLSCDNGFELLLGIPQSLGCVQHSSADGASPNLLAVSDRPPLNRGYIEFLTANTPTPVAARYVISFDELMQIALHFLRTGERSGDVSWWRFYPHALQEDAERPADS